ncbi:unnamed protein product [Strongylus vulgaris]|uniref:Uncharacterized protein n=1 Tax=Strongylus vulgaris TaxID=40348 RepID=A0A3P7IYX6_STRVU|nr:unnamed protein product [Strongylus vulgaris]
MDEIEILIKHHFRHSSTSSLEEFGETFHNNVSPPNLHPPELRGNSKSVPDGLKISLDSPEGHKAPPISPTSNVSWFVDELPVIEEEEQDKRRVSEGGSWFLVESSKTVFFFEIIYPQNHCRAVKATAPKQRIEVWNPMRAICQFLRGETSNKAKRSLMRKKVIKEINAGIRRYFNFFRHS